MTIILQVSLYFLLLALLGYKASQATDNASPNGYFLADRKIGTFNALFSVVATETSVATILIFPAVGMNSGLALTWLVIGYCIGRIIIAIWYLPFLYNQHVLSIYSSITKDNSLNSKILSFAFLLAKYLSSGVRLYMGAYALNQLLGGSISLWLTVLVLLAGAYSLAGGLHAIILTDQMQGYILIGVGIILLIFLGRTAQISSDLQWINSTISLHNAMSWPALIIGGAVLTIGSHGTDQDLLQRVLATPSLRSAQWALALSGLGAGVVIIIYLLVGWLLSSQGIYELDAKSPLIDFVKQSNLPWLIGLMTVLLMAAAMSTLDSVLHATGAIWKSILNSPHSGRWWSFISLLILFLSAHGFIFASNFADSFLSLAMSAMNYVNGGMIGIFTSALILRRPVSTLALVSGLLTGFVATVICSTQIIPAIAWSWTIIFSSLSSLIITILMSVLFKEKEKYEISYNTSKRWSSWSDQ